MGEPRIIFDYHPGFAILCVALGIGYAVLLYNTKHSWNKNINRLLFILRVILIALLAVLLLGPILKHINNLFEKPVFVLLYDDSVSIAETSDSSALQLIKSSIADATAALQDAGFETEIQTVSGNDPGSYQFAATSSDIAGGLKEIANRYEGRKIGGVALISDGIYNTGISPLYGAYNFPVYALAIGDTAVRNDLSIKNVDYNKVAYQGNKFPVKVDVMAKGYQSGNITVSLMQRGKVLETKTEPLNHSLLTFNFTPEANENGIQRFDIQVQERIDETNLKNNNASIFIEVVEGKKKILMVAQSPHPDIKAFREVIEQNSNYEFLFYLPGISELEPSVIQPDKIDLAIFHQSPDLRGRTRNLFTQFVKSKTSLFLVISSQTDLQEITRQGLPFGFESPPRSYDDVMASVNPNFSLFTLSTEVNTLVAEYPPVSVHFGRMIPTNTISLLTQKVGSVVSERPLLNLYTEGDRKIGFLMGDGVWRWRLYEYDRTQKSIAFDELFGKLFQYLSITDDKSKFRSYPVRQEFSETVPVVIESQVYNDIYEPVFGNTIELEITSEEGERTNYSYVLSPGNSQYQIGGLTEGVYRYTSKTNLDGEPATVRGQFVVIAQQAELQNLTADFQLLRQLSANTGGKFYTLNQTRNMLNDLQQKTVSSVIRSEETFESAVNLPWVFVILLLLVSSEWFIRKFMGSY